jgi:hypothetical protein
VSTKDSGEVKQQAQPWKERLAKERVTRTDKLKADLEDAEKRLTDVKDELAETKKKHKIAIAAVITAKKDNEFKKQIAELNQKVELQTRKRDEVKKALDWVGWWEPSIDISELRVGQIGRLKASDDMVPIFTIIQVVDTSHMIVRHNDQFYWIEGLSTAKAADGKQFTISDVVECPGNHTYGVRTMLVLRVVDTEEKK